MLKYTKWLYCLSHAVDLDYSSKQATVERLKQVVSDASEKISDLQSDPPQLEDALQSMLIFLNIYGHTKFMSMGATSLHMHF